MSSYLGRRTLGGVTYQVRRPTYPTTQLPYYLTANQLCANYQFKLNPLNMSEIKSSGIKGYALLGALIVLLLFVILVVYIYKANNNFVPEKPEYWSQLAATSVRALLA